MSVMHTVTLYLNFEIRILLVTRYCSKQHCNSLLFLSHHGYRKWVSYFHKIDASKLSPISLWGEIQQSFIIAKTCHYSLLTS